MRGCFRAQSFHGEDLTAEHRIERRVACGHATAVDQHGTGAAEPLATAEPDTDDPELVSQHVEKHQSRAVLDHLVAAVDLEREHSSMSPQGGPASADPAAGRPEQR